MMAKCEERDQGKFNCGYEARLILKDVLCKEGKVTPVENMIFYVNMWGEHGTRWIQLNVGW